ncbi:MAG: hypothetical protein AAB250_15660 [Bdellovibrionota bacterium]
MNFKKLALLPIAIIMIAAGIAGAKSKISKPTPRSEGLVAPGSVTARGPEVPFPLSASLPFPWNKIEGMWEGRLDGRSMLFSFDVQVDYDGNSLLRVAQLDGATGVVISDGIGITSGNDNLVRAAMYGVYTGDSYMLFIGSYKNPRIAPSSKKAVTVLTLRAFGEMTGDSDQQLVMKKLSSIPYLQEWSTDTCE